MESEKELKAERHKHLNDAIKMAYDLDGYAAKDDKIEALLEQLGNPPKKARKRVR